MGARLVVLLVVFGALAGLLAGAPYDWL